MFMFIMEIISCKLLSAQTYVVPRLHSFHLDKVNELRRKRGSKSDPILVSQKPTADFKVRRDTPGRFTTVMKRRGSVVKFCHIHKHVRL